jgi:hypothetical protein
MTTVASSTTRMSIGYGIRGGSLITITNTGRVLWLKARCSSAGERWSAFVRIIVGVQLVHSHVGVVWAYTGAEMQSLFEMWDQHKEKLT